VNTQPHPIHTHAGISALRLAPLAIAAVLLLPVGAAVAAPRTAPQLSIAVDDHQTSASEGDTLGYAIIVKNLGGQRVSGLHVSQTVPAGLVLRRADAQGVAGHRQVSWRVTLAPGSTKTLHTTMEVQATPKDLLRLASVACAGVTSNRPIVCATHSDQLPAGAVAARAVTRASGSSHVRTIWMGGGLAGLLIAAGGVVALVVRRRHGPGQLRPSPRH
jgi:uncharacterized repeat protein (TIGR01451 family)